VEVPESGIRDFEFQQSFRAVYGGEVTPDQTEVAEVRSVEPEELAVEFESRPENFTPWFRQRANDLDLFSVWKRLFSCLASV
jgi:isopentenyldiphosphate isomerase